MSADPGYIYVLINQSTPKMVKIGKTAHSPYDRAMEIGGTGLPTPFLVAYAPAVTNCSEAENRVHNILRNRRVSQDREFFRVTETEAIHAILEHCFDLYRDPIAVSTPGGTSREDTEDRREEGTPSGGDSRPSPDGEWTFRAIMSEWPSIGDLHSHVPVILRELNRFCGDVIVAEFRAPEQWYHCLVRRRAWPMAKGRPRVGVGIAWDMNASRINPWGVGVRVEYLGKLDRFPSSLEVRLGPPHPRSLSQWWPHAHCDILASQKEREDSCVFAERLFNQVRQTWDRCATKIDRLVEEEGLIV